MGFGSSRKAQTSSRANEDRPPYITHKDTEERRLAIYRMEAFQKGKLPSNEDCHETLGHWEHSLATIDRSKISSQGNQFLEDLRKLLILVDRILDEKNKDEKIQKLIYHTRLASEVAQAEWKKKAHLKINESKVQNRKIYLGGTMDETMAAATKKMRKKMNEDVKAMISFLRQLVTAPGFRNMLGESRKLIANVFGYVDIKEEEEEDEPLPIVQDINLMTTDPCRVTPFELTEKPVGLESPHVRFVEEGPGSAAEHRYMTEESKLHEGESNDLSPWSQKIRSEVSHSLDDLHRRLHTSSFDPEVVTSETVSPHVYSTSEYQGARESGQASMKSQGSKELRPTDVDLSRIESFPIVTTQAGPTAPPPVTFVSGAPAQLTLTSELSEEMKHKKKIEKQDERFLSDLGKLLAEASKDKRFMHSFEDMYRLAEHWRIDFMRLRKTSFYGTEEASKQTAKSSQSLYEAWKEHRRQPTIVSSVSKKSKARRAALHPAGIESTDVLPTPIQHDANIVQVLNDAKLLIESFANGRSMDPILDAWSDLNDAMQSDHKLADYIKDWVSFIRDSTLKGPEYVLHSQEFKARGSYLLNRGRALKSELYGALFERVHWEIDQFAQALREDPLTQEFIEQTRKVLDHFFLGSQISFEGSKEDGGEKKRATSIKLPHTNLLNDLRQLIIPAIISQSKYLPLPRVEITSNTYDILLDDIVLDLSEVLPKDIDVYASQHLHVVPTEMGSTAPEEWVGAVQIKLAASKLNVKDVAFYYRKKTGIIRAVDAGHTDVFIHGKKGLSIEINLHASPLALRQEAKSLFDVKKVKCNISRLSLNFHETKYTAVYALIKPVITARLKANICRTVEREIREFFVTINKRLTAFQAVA